MAKTATRAPNEERGEFSVVLDGQEMVLRPSYEAISEFEQDTGKGLLDLTRAAATGSLTLGDTAIVVCACIRAWGRATKSQSVAASNPERIRQLILESDGGPLSVMTMLSAVLAMAATGGMTAQGEAKATMTTSPKTTA